MLRRPGHLRELLLLDAAIRLAAEREQPAPPGQPRPRRPGREEPLDILRAAREEAAHRRQPGDPDERLLLRRTLRLARRRGAARCASAARFRRLARACAG